MNNDVLDGGSGNDTLKGGSGTDRLIGGTGNDTLYFDSEDAINGGTGYDTAYVENTNGVTLDLDAASIESVVGGSGNDRFFATTLSVKISSGSGNDTLLTGSGNDVLDGGDGDDLISAGEGNNTLKGGSGNDELIGGNGQDSLIGVNTGNDRGQGSIDRLTGGQGADQFSLGDAKGTFYDDGIKTSNGLRDYALITDFNSYEDVIQLSGQASDYVLGVPEVGVNGIGIYRDSDRNSTFTSSDELIAILQNVQSISLTDTSFLYM